jgi:hypothetical protein
MHVGRHFIPQYPYQFQKEKKMTKIAKTAAASATIRKAATRKALTKEIRALERIRVSIEKAAAVISTQGEDVTGDAGNQIADMLYKMGVSVSVVNAGINEKAGHLAATYIK